MAIANSLIPTDEAIRRPATDYRCRPPCARRSQHGRTPAPSPNVSCACAMLTRPCLTAWAATKRDFGVKRRKRLGPLRRCDSRRLQSGSGATESRPSPGIGSGRFRLTHSLAVECSDGENCARRGSLRKSVKAGKVIRFECTSTFTSPTPTPGASSKLNGVSKWVEEMSWHFCRSCRC
jgi:hypothetical protein